MDNKISKFFKEEREKTKTRDTNHNTPTSKIPDLQWKDYTPSNVEVQDIIVGESMNNVYKTSKLLGYVLHIVGPRARHALQRLKKK